MLRLARHWPKAIIAAGVMLTFVWMGILAWLLVSAIEAMT